MNEENLLKTIGQRIMLRRKQLGYTQEQAAEKSNLSHQFFSAVETGRKNLRAESIIKVAMALEVSADYLLFGLTNQSDMHYIIEKLSELSGLQLHCLEEIIKNYMLALDSDEEAQDLLVAEAKHKPY